MEIKHSNGTRNITIALKKNHNNEHYYSPRRLSIITDPLLNHNLAKLQPRAQSSANNGIVNRRRTLVTGRKVAPSAECAKSHMLEGSRLQIGLHHLVVPRYTVGINLWRI